MRDEDGFYWSAGVTVVGILLGDLEKQLPDQVFQKPFHLILQTMLVPLDPHISLRHPVVPEIRSRSVWVSIHRSQCVTLKPGPKPT